MAGCDHGRMLSSVKVPVLLTHHFRRSEPDTGHVLGALSGVQADRVRELVTEAGQTVVYRSFPVGHFMHAQDPTFFARKLIEWVGSLQKG